MKTKPNGHAHLSPSDRDRLSHLADLAASRGKTVLATKILSVLGQGSPKPKRAKDTQGPGDVEISFSDDSLGRLSKKIRKKVGDDIADTFDELGAKAYQELTENVKATILKTLTNKKTEIEERLKKDFGNKGASKAVEYIEDWFSNLTQQMADHLPDHIEETLEKVKNNNEVASPSEKPGEEKEASAERGLNKMTKLSRAKKVIKKAAAVLRSIGEEDLARSLITGDLTDLEPASPMEDEDEDLDQDMGMAPEEPEDEDVEADLDLDDEPMQSLDDDEDDEGLEDEDMEEDEDEEEGPEDVAASLRDIAREVKARGEKKLAKEILAAADDLEEDEDEGPGDDDDDLEDEDLEGEEELHADDDDEDDDDNEDEEEPDEDEDEDKQEAKKASKEDLNVVVGSLIKRGEYGLASEILAAMDEGGTPKDDEDDSEDTEPEEDEDDLSDEEDEELNAFLDLEG